MHHPPGQLPAEAGAVGDADLHAGELPEVGYPGRTEQRFTVRCMRYRSPYDPLDALVSQDRDPFEGPFEPEADAVVVGVEQRVLE